MKTLGYGNRTPGLNWLWIALVVALLLPRLVAAQTSLTGASASLTMTLGTPFSQTFVGTFGAGQSYQLLGSLPPGLSFAATGGTATVSGTPTALGSYSFSIRVLPPPPPPPPTLTGIPVPPVLPYDSPLVATVSGFTVANPATLAVPYGVAGSVDLTPFVAASSAPVSVAIASAPGNGTASLAGNRLNYVPAPGFSGTDVLTYVATAGGITSRPATVTISVGVAPNPTRVPGVVGIQQAAGAAVRHLQVSQLDNFNGRLSEIRGEDDIQRRCNKLTVWTAGLQAFGTLGNTGGDRFRYDRKGVSIGGDRCFDDKVFAGVGVGYGRERSTLNGDPSALAGNAATVAAYGGIHVSPRLRVDWVVGTGRVDMSYDRYVGDLGDFAHGQWSANQWLSSAAASYRFSFGDLRIVPYSRVDLATVQRDAYSESGAAGFALAYQGQRLSTGRTMLGVDSEYRYEGEFGEAIPRVKVEYQRDFARREQIGVGYVAGAGNFTLPADNQESRVLLITAGTEIRWRNGLSLSVQLGHARSNGGNSGSSGQLRLAQKF